MANRNVTISVVIPVKDDAAMLERCLQSLAGQSRPPDEILVVDNASSDDSVRVAERHGVSVIFEGRPGITAAASAGYDAASGDIIARCDADSRLPPDWIERIEHTLAAQPHAVAVTGGGVFYDLGAAGNWLARIFYLNAYFVLARTATANRPLFGSNFAIRGDVWRELSDQVPRDLPELHDDFDLTFRLPPESEIIYDRDLTVGISGRPFNNLGSMGRRMMMANLTILEHTPHRMGAARWWQRSRSRRA